MRVGMFGGAFDPPHNAHVALAAAALDQLKLDELRIFPTGHAWHRKQPTTPAEDRVAMARLAFEDIARVVVDDREIHRPGATYTVDTLRELRREVEGVELFLVMGEDQASAFKSWHEWAEIARIATLCVAKRASTDSTGSARTGISVRPELACREPVESVEGPAFTPIHFPDMPISATAIRERARRGEDISSLVPPAVAGYIAAHHLYRGH